MDSGGHELPPVSIKSEHPGSHCASDHDMSEALPVDGIPEEQTKWIGTSYRAKYILSGHTMAISSVKFNPTGSVLASAGTCTPRQPLVPP